MKAYWRAAAAIAALTAAMTLGALLPATPGHSQVARQVVRVLQNGPSDAVPVFIQGSAPTPTPQIVRIGNTAGAPALFRDVDHLVPYQAAAAAADGDNSTVLNVFFPPAPAGKRLEIGFASAEAHVPSGQSVNCAVITSSDVKHSLRLSLQGAGFIPNHDFYVGTERVEAFANAGDLVFLHLNRTGSTGAWSVTGSLAGYLVDQ